MGWEAAGRWLVRASGPRSYRIWAELDGDGDHADPDYLAVQGHAGANLDYLAWEHGMEQECNGCRAAPPRRCARSSARPDLDRRDLAPAGPAAWRPVATGNVERGQCLAVLRGDAERCLWPIGAQHW